MKIRNEAYIGVLIDDLVTKGVEDPYRLLTSRSEYRLLLRNDNADLRLSKYGKKLGLLSDEQYNKFIEKEQNIEELINYLKNNYLTPKKVTNEYLESINTPTLKDRISLYDILKRPEVSYEDIKEFIPKSYDLEVIDEVEINIKYDGYIKKQEKEAEKMLEYENVSIPEDFNYLNIQNLALEAREKLNKIRPTSIGQAMRISGVNPADISILMIELKRRKYE